MPHVPRSRVPQGGARVRRCLRNNSFAASNQHPLTTRTSSDASVSSPPPSDWTRWWNRTRYQLYAPIYDWVAQPVENGRKRAIERLSLTPDDRILILGCGPGSDLEYLPHDASITAVDAAPAMVRRARERAEDLGMDVNAQVGDAQTVPFDEDSFDVVLPHLILSVVPNPEVVAAEAARVVAPNGRVSIYDKFIPEDTEPSFLRRPQHRRAKSVCARGTLYHCPGTTRTPGTHLVKDGLCSPHRGNDPSLRKMTERFICAALTCRRSPRSRSGT